MKLPGSGESPTHAASPAHAPQSRRIASAIAVVAMTPPRARSQSDWLAPRNASGQSASGQGAPAGPKLAVCWLHRAPVASSAS
jgi:hypothetical protein